MGAWSLSRWDHRGSPYLTSCIWPHLLRHSILSLGGPSSPLPEPSQPVGEPSCGLSTLYLSFILPFLGVSGIRLCCLLLPPTQPLICLQERWVRTMESSKPGQGEDLCIPDSSSRQTPERTQARLPRDLCSGETSVLGS